MDVPPTYRSLLAEYPDIMGSGFSDLQPKHGVDHHILAIGQPVFTPAHRLDPAANLEFDKMEQAGIVRRSNSTWASALHMVPKPDGLWRPCGDFRRLNNATVPDKYLIPHIRDFTNRLAGSHMFSKLDLVKGYYQIPMNPADIPKTAVITPFGMDEFLVMPFGLCNAGASFQRMTDRVMSGLPFVFCYLDDVLIASPDQGLHLEDPACCRQVSPAPHSSALYGSPKAFVWVWTTSMQEAFLSVKAAVCDAVVLEHPVPGAHLSLAVDASATHVGVVFQHFRKGSWSPLSFFSRKLLAAEVRYSAFDREVLAVYLAVRHFRFMLEA